MFHLFVCAYGSVAIVKSPSVKQISQTFSKVFWAFFENIGMFFETFRRPTFFSTHRLAAQFWAGRGAWRPSFFFDVAPGGPINFFSFVAFRFRFRFVFSFRFGFRFVFGLEITLKRRVAFDSRHLLISNLMKGSNIFCELLMRTIFT